VYENVHGFENFSEKIFSGRKKAAGQAGGWEFADSIFSRNLTSPLV
jgi:hypothetical protein